MAFHGETQPHFVLLPFMAQGHLIPMVDIARLLAERDVIISILLTPTDANRVKNVINRAIDSGLSIRVFHLKFPCAEAGLPEGCENCDMLPSPDYMFNLFSAIAMLREQVEELLQQLNPLPTCLIADTCISWATSVALKLRIPRLVFNVSCCYGLLYGNLLEPSKDSKAITSDTNHPVVPDGIPPEAAVIVKEMQDSEKEAFGVVANTIEEMEAEYVEEYIKVRGKKFWCIGPVSLCNKEDSDRAERGNKVSIDQHQCLKWLDSQEPSSVIYTCFGSLSNAFLSTSQLIELGLGLEASNRPFIWVIRDASDELKTWLAEEKFEERIKGRGLLIQGWAPQVLILSHPSLGGFLTHCGWNSTLEGITAGQPMITWPLFVEQFCIEKFIVNVIKTGLKVGEVVFQHGQEAGVQVKRDDIKIAIDKLMDAGEEGEERRERARKLREIAKGAVEEGGSSYNNITLLIQEVIMQHAKLRDQSAKDKKFDYGNSSEIVIQ